VTPDYALALTTGLLGGFGHCLGMCGPVVAAFSLRAGPARALPQLLYHAGRLTTYAFLGTLMGIAGSYVNAAGRLAGLQDAISLCAGALMILAGLAVLGALPLPSPARRLAGAWLAASRPFLDGPSPLALYPLGLLLGLLPCGLSATALLMAAGTASPARGFLVALLFGLGTVPALLLFGLAAGWLGARLRGGLCRLGGAAVLAAGILLVRRGLAAHAGL
jgi:sulfite exporter TauE/SafE